MADEAGNRGAFLIQEHYCRAMDAPIYAAICAAVAAHLTRASAVGARILDWLGEPTRDALPLRLIGGLHALVLAGRDEELAAVFSGIIAGDAIAPAIERVLARHEAALMPWLDGPPQTNEPGRSAALMCGLIEIARRHGPRIELLEIGSSAGLNLLIGRYRFDLGGTTIGPTDSPITIRPEWTGAPPPTVPVEIESARGCDVAPMDATDPAVAARLSAYVWAEKPERLERLRTAIAMVRERGVRLDHADAADWVEARLAEPQAAGVTRVLMHSVVWQYLPQDSAARVRTAMLAAGARATAERPIGWVMMEPDRALAHQLIRVMSWPGHADPAIVGTAHAHAAWIRYGAPEGDRDAIALPTAAQVWP
ncbi:DUF2332 domain-containing protein [Sphingomonas sp.]|uniref:DUF2332 domain-containing protein n=1 Tax=Sphingomonas sp. TaxID=28214 RepID=UPI002CB2E3C1|nr:DUF2332 family protein [Sphingomonas sp.]HWK34970.1 DUF2332 family protein [Sphingomonas sp.]